MLSAAAAQAEVHISTVANTDSYIGGVTLDQNAAEPTIYVSETYRHRVVRIRLAKMSNGTIAPITEVIAGTGTPGFADDTLAGQSRLHEPHGLALSPNGTLLIADRRNCRLRAVSPDQFGNIAPESTITTIAGGNSSTEFHPNGSTYSANQLSLQFPEGIAVGPNGTIFVADTLNHRIHKIQPNPDGNCSDS